MDTREPVGRSLPVVTRSTTLREAVAILSDARVRWLLVAEADNIPRAALSGTDILRALMPSYLLQDPTLARVYNREAAREVIVTAMKRNLGDVLDEMEARNWALPTVPPEPTVLEIAAEFVRTGSTVAYIEGSGPKDPRFATLPGLFQRISERME